MGCAGHRMGMQSKSIALAGYHSLHEAAACNEGAPMHHGLSRDEHGHEHVIGVHVGSMDIYAHVH